MTSDAARETARRLGREMQDECGIYHATVVGMIAAAIDHAVAEERQRCAAIIERDSQAPRRASYGELKARILSGEPE